MPSAGHPPDRTGGAEPAPGEPRITTITLREALADPRYRYPLLLDEHLLLLVTVGHGTCEVDFRTHQCRPGSLIRVRAGQVVRYGGQPGLDAIIVTWPPGLLDGLGPASAEARSGYWQLAGEDEDAIVNEVSQLVVDCQRHRWEEHGAELLRHQLAVLLHRLALLAPGGRAGANLTRPGVPSPVDTHAESTYQRLRREIERSYWSTRRVEDYAARLDCSVRTLTRACLAATGRSAKQVIDDRVALQAMRLLAATELPIAEIGGRLGFSEPTNFGRFFHREVGQTPGAFRSRLRNDRYGTRFDERATGAPSAHPTRHR